MFNNPQRRRTMQTDTLTRDERKLQIAAAVATDHVAEVSLDIRRMRELGSCWR
jgi:hypothetical protein